MFVALSLDIPIYFNIGAQVWTFPMKRGSESVSFIGLGYVGLCTAAVLASRGMKIIGVDIDGEKIAKLAKGETPLHEPGLGSMLKSAVKNRRIQFTTDIDRVVEADVTFITVVNAQQSRWIHQPNVCKE